MVAVTPEQVEALDGWFTPMDQDVFRHLLTATRERLGHGDLAELGTYLGKSTVLVGAYLHEDETFTVIDLFGSDAADPSNRAENADQYADLTRAAFEQNYRAVHRTLPTVVQGPSARIIDHAGHGTHRFVHVDASHLYDHVVADVQAARTLLQPDGVVVFDDYRTEHTPGVAAAVWGAVATGGLRPFAITPVKLYATFGDAAPWAASCGRFAEEAGIAHEVQSVAGLDLVRLFEVVGADYRWVPYVPPVLLHRAKVLRARVARARR